jgi:hypothetical protein
MIRLLAVAVALGLSALACAGAGFDQVVLRSRSGQFLVRGLPVQTPAGGLTRTSSVSYVRVDPAALAVSLDRIRQAVLGELKLNAAWVGAISVTVRPGQAANEPIDVLHLRYADRWGYRMSVPDPVDRARLLEAVVMVLLQEFADRQAESRTAELPPWLAKGLAAHLRATTLAELTLEPQTSAYGEGRKADPLRHVRPRLRAEPPLNFDNLCWPASETGTEADAGLYEACAQLFVYELLRLRDGATCVREMLTLLPTYYNWQTAFLDAFQRQFRSLKDVDKWWSLKVVEVTGREPDAQAARAEGWRLLDEVLGTTVEVRLTTNDLPAQTSVRLQSIIAEWDGAQQEPLLREKIRLLGALRWRVSGETQRLADGYRATLEAYLRNRSKPGGGNSKLAIAPSQKINLRGAVKRLNELDARRAQTSSSPHRAAVAARTGTASMSEVRPTSRAGK